MPTDTEMTLCVQVSVAKLDALFDALRAGDLDLAREIADEIENVAAY